jgi:hypothetical protein
VIVRGTCGKLSATEAERERTGLRLERGPCEVLSLSGIKSCGIVIDGSPSSSIPVADSVYPRKRTNLFWKPAVMRERRLVV